MPIFEYRCRDCGKVFEQLVFGSDPTVECPECHQSNVEKLMSACAAKVGFKFTSASGGGGSCAGCTATSCSSCSSGSH
ncbi:MAG: zinc ribbon domain-containing protein [Desulfobacca sp.]|nr:zinc ribbon domain-containing protein [Desulfobacca sp.]